MHSSATQNLGSGNFIIPMTVEDTSRSRTRFRHHPYSWSISRISSCECEARPCAPCSVDDGEARADLRRRSSSPFVFDRSHSLHSCGLSVDGSGADSAPSTPPAGSLSPLSHAVADAGCPLPHQALPTFGEPIHLEDCGGSLSLHTTYPSSALQMQCRTEAIGVACPIPLHKEEDRSTSRAAPKRRTSPAATAVAAAPILSGSKPVLVKYALVQFKFHSEYFVAPFRVGPGDAVVTSEGEGCCISRIGLVRHVAAGPSEMRAEFSLPPLTKTLIRHAREHDRQCKNRVIAVEASDLAAVAKHVASGGVYGAAGRFTVCDLEWCQDCRHAAVFIGCAQASCPKDLVFLSSAIREVLQSLRGTHDVSIRLVECPRTAQGY